MSEINLHRGGRFPWSFRKSVYESPVITLGESHVSLTEEQYTALCNIGRGDIEYDAWVLRLFIAEMQAEADRLAELVQQTAPSETS